MLIKNLHLLRKCLNYENFILVGTSLTKPSKSFVCTSSEDKRLYQWKYPDGHDTGIKIANAYKCLKIKNSKVPFIVKNPQKIMWYSCGPTVYDSPHIGHASSYIRFDTIRRILCNYFNFNVFHVMGITDIDDKIIVRAGIQNQEFLSMAAYYEEEFKVAMNNINVIPPSIYVRVSDVLPQIILFISKLLKNGYAYKSENGNVWFNVNGFTKLGRLNYIMKEWEESETSKIISEKQSTKDFALWKSAKPGEPYWDAPWGKGRPGWHIECSTISSLVFGCHFDVHSGAKDLSLHHECEIYQSEAFYSSNQWVNYFLHSGHLFSKDSVTKMSKSLGNVVNVHDFLKNYTADVLRFFCLSSNWGSHLEYHPGSISLAQKNVNYLQIFLTKCKQYAIGNLHGKVNDPEITEMLEKAKMEISNLLSDNFNTESVLSLIMKLCKKLDCMFSPSCTENVINEICLSRESNCVVDVYHFVTDIFTMLGFTSIKAEGTTIQYNSVPNGSFIDKKLLSDLQVFRTEIRKIAFSLKEQNNDVAKKLFKTSDDIRNKLSKKGKLIQDSKL